MFSKFPPVGGQSSDRLTNQVVARRYPEVTGVFALRTQNGLDSLPRTAVEYPPKLYGSLAYRPKSAQEAGPPEFWMVTCDSQESFY